MPDLSRRSLLAGLLAAPVVAPAAAMGMVEAVKAQPFATGGYVRGWTTLYGSPRFAALSRPPISERSLEAFADRAADAMIDDFFDNSAEIRALVADLGRTEGHSADILDEDVATYCAVV